jgi:aryl-alcohol dehydrogenase-like predicted oxidoreductase
MATTTQTETYPVIAVDTSKSKTAVNVVLGTMNIGRQGMCWFYQFLHSLWCNLSRTRYLTYALGAPLTRMHDLKDCAALLDVFQEHGHAQIDTARLYGFGSTEEYLSHLKWQDRGLLVGTKLNPKKIGPKPFSHKPEDLKRGVLESLKALDTKQFDIFYLHLPDVSNRLPFFSYSNR